MKLGGLRAKKTGELVGHLIVAPFDVAELEFEALKVESPAHNLG